MMDRLRYVLVLGALAMLTQACQNNTTVKTDTPATQTAPQPSDETAVLDVLKTFVEEDLTIPVSLKTDYFKSENQTAYVSATILKKDGSKMDFKGTPYDEQANEGGAFSDGVIGLLEKKDGKWDVLTLAVGPTDVPSVCWHKEFGVSKTLFPDGLSADDCVEQPPFIFADQNRMFLNGRLVKTFEELKSLLTKALMRMTSLPQEVEPAFGENTGMGLRAEVRTIISEALQEVRQAKSNNPK